ncbi:hypothetical protein D3C76_1542450 [compost metagenome]
MGLRRRHITTQRFPKVMNQAQLEHLADIDITQLFFEHQRQQRQPPTVLGRAFRPACRRVGTACHALEPFGLAQEFEFSMQVVMRHDG